MTPHCTLDGVWMYGIRVYIRNTCIKVKDQEEECKSPLHGIFESVQRVQIVNENTLHVSNRKYVIFFEQVFTKRRQKASF